MVSTLAVNVTHGLFYFRLKTKNPFQLALCYLLPPLALPPAVWLSNAIPVLIPAVMVGYIAFCMWVHRVAATNDSYSRILLGASLVVAFSQGARLLLLSVFINGLGYPVERSAELTNYFFPVVFILASPFLYYVVRPRVRTILDIAETQRWYVVGLPPVILTVMGTIGNLAVMKNPESSLIMALALLMPLAIAAFFLSLYLFLTNLQDKLVLNERLAATEQLEETYQFYDRQLAEKESRLQLIRHDFRHLVVHLEELAREWDRDGILRELAAVSAASSQTAIKPFCENRTVNAVVSSHFEQAEKLGVNCTAKAFVPENLAIPKADLSMILGNALENCIKAAGPLGESGYITFEAKPGMGFMMFEFANNYSPGGYAKGKGVGLASIQHICEQHHGRMEVVDTGKEFRLTMFLAVL